jgi:hypothetical protein
MTTTTGMPGGAGGGSVSAGAGSRRGRATVALVLVGLAVVLLVLIALAAPATRNDGDPLDPTSTSATGTKAAVELAGRLGADVEVVSDIPGDDVDVALMFEDLTADAVVGGLQDWVAAGHILVIADPASQLTPPAELEGVDPFEDSSPIENVSCDATRPEGLDDLGVLEAFGTVARFEVPAGARSCFDDGTGAVVVVEQIGDGLLVAVGTPWVFTNQALDQSDNAGLFAALAVPERGTRLAVLVAGPELEPAASDGSLGLPTSVVLGLLQLLVAFVVYCLFRARRLGKPVPEDPPVVIAGSELVRAVGGLLEHAGARDRAATSLRRSARRRLAGAFGLPAATSSDSVVSAVSARTALDRERLSAALSDAPVRDDGALAALSRELDDIVAAALGRAAPAGTEASGEAPPGPGSSEPEPHTTSFDTPGEAP